MWLGLPHNMVAKGHEKSGGGMRKIRPVGGVLLYTNHPQKSCITASAALDGWESYTYRKGGRCPSISSLREVE